MASVSVQEVETHLSELIDRVLAGEEVTVTRNGEPVIRLVPAVAPVRKKQLLGAMKGRISFDESFFDPLPDEFLGPWKGDKTR